MSYKSPNARERCIKEMAQVNKKGGWCMIPGSNQAILTPTAKHTCETK